MIKPLAGIRVLDFSKVLAGPLCTQYLGDLGADIIKVEPCAVGDETRGWPPFHGDTAAFFLSVNRNKRSLAVDLKTETGREIAHKLARAADVVLESYGTGVVERLGIDFATIKRERNDLIYCSISGFGRTGPLKGNLGYDVILQAFSGIMSMTGEIGGGPVRSPFSPIDQATGLHALTGIMAAILERNRTGKGCYLEVSLFETAVAFLGYNLQTYWESGRCPRSPGQVTSRFVLIRPSTRATRRFSSVSPTTTCGGASAGPSIATSLQPIRALRPIAPGSLILPRR